MIFDALTTLSSAQDLTGAAAATPSTNSLDLSVQRDIGVSEEPIVVVWNTLPTGAGNITVDIQTSTDNATWTTIESGTAQPIANYTGQNAFAFRSMLPVGVKRYLRLLYTTTGTLTSGALTACIGAEYEAQIYYNKNYVA